MNRPADDELLRQLDLALEEGQVLTELDAWIDKLINGWQYARPSFDGDADAQQLNRNLATMMTAVGEQAAHRIDLLRRFA